MRLSAQCTTALLIINPLEDQTCEKSSEGQKWRQPELQDASPFFHPETGTTKACVSAPVSPDPLASITPYHCLIYSMD